MQHMIVSSKPNPDHPRPAPADPLAWRHETPFFQAGLAGYSDAAMRLIARRHGCPYAITEAMLDQFLIQGGKGRRAAEIPHDDHPIAGQLMGSPAADIALGAKVLLNLGYDVIDINLACPVKKIKKKCRGGHLLSSPDDAVAIIKSVRDAVGDTVPLTVKMRRGYDDSPPMTANFHKIFAAVIDNHFAAATVHGRTVQQKYLGPSRWAFLAELTKQYPDFTIFGSGDIFTPQAIFDMIQQTGVRAVAVARGCIGDPWIFQQARQLMAGQSPTPPTIDQQRQVLREHFELSVGLHGEQAAGRMMRKFGIKFARHHPQSDDVAKAFIAVKSLADWQSVIDQHYRSKSPVTAA